MTLHGGAHNVPIDHKTINAVKFASMTYHNAKEAEKKAAEEEVKRAEAEEIERQKRKARDDETKTCERKKKSLEDDISDLKNNIETQQNIQAELMKRAGQSSNVKAAKDIMGTVEVTMKVIQENTAKLWSKEDSLKRLITKKKQLETIDLN